MGTEVSNKPSDLSAALAPGATPSSVDRLLEAAAALAERLFPTAEIVRRGDHPQLAIPAELTEEDRRRAELLATLLAEADQGRRELGDQQSLYRTLVEQLPAVTYYRRIGDVRGHAAYMSPQLKDLLGVDPEDFTSGPERWRSMLHPDDRASVLAEQARLDDARSVAPVSVEYRMVRPDGRVVWVRNTAVTVSDAGGVPRFVLGVLADITERKAAEETLQQSVKREAVARFAGGVAHDFNNVLGAILAYASHLRDGGSDQERREALDEIIEAARRGYELTRELSALAQADDLDARPPRDPAIPSPRPPPVEPASPTTPRTLLLVDDENAVRRAMTAILERRGYVVIPAASGEEALSTILRDDVHIDLLLTDVVMPGMGGRELVERARARRPDLRVAFASGFTDDEVLRREFARADLMLLQKPFSASELTAFVNQALARPEI
jgi:PAS domain S-box-containing protein